MSKRQQSIADDNTEEESYTYKRQRADDKNDDIGSVDTSTPTHIEPEGKIKFMMGYLPGCKRCELKTPGHFSHWWRV